MHLSCASFDSPQSGVWYGLAAARVDAGSDRPEPTVPTTCAPLAESQSSAVILVTRVAGTCVKSRAIRTIGNPGLPRLPGRADPSGTKAAIRVRRFRLLVRFNKCLGRRG